MPKTCGKAKAAIGLGSGREKEHSGVEAIGLLCQFIGLDDRWNHLSTHMRPHSGDPFAQVLFKLILPRQGGRGKQRRFAAAANPISKKNEHSSVVTTDCIGIPRAMVAAKPAILLHNEHRTRRELHDAVGTAANQSLIECRVTGRADHHEIGADV